MKSEEPASQKRISAGEVSSESWLFPFSHSTAQPLNHSTTQPIPDPSKKYSGHDLLFAFEAIIYSIRFTNTR
ncbi:MAG TPA: hypothetical protein VLJ10_03560 [Candidatus Bathyarchaeia archaeon]|nr:hypothetical protein [Candidatus Bathyarchaeia archaeon]